MDEKEFGTLAGKEKSLSLSLCSLLKLSLSLSSVSERFDSEMGRFSFD